MAMTPLTAIDNRVEMFQRGFAIQPRDTFFHTKAQEQRPVSSATEFDTEFEDDMSDVDDEAYARDVEYREDIQYASDEDLNIPRLSYRSAGRTSETTLSSYEEVLTPNSTSNEFQSFNFDLDVKKPVEGPRGPHLFRSSVSSSLDIPDQYVLEMSPLTPSATGPTSQFSAAPPIPTSPGSPRRHRHLSSLTDAVENLNLNEVAKWSTHQVARWMRDAGFDPSIVEKFRENDISGAILITLKFEDLRELDIPSFGQRTKVWNEIHVLRGSATNTPKPVTPIEETSPSIDFRSFRDAGNQDRGRSQSCASDHDRGHSRRRKGSRRPRKHETVMPLESISIVGIEQLMPKPHNCSKGENCSKWRKQQRLIAAFNKDHPISPEEGGTILVAGDPGNALTARPVSDAVPSVVASSDVLGPGTTPAFRHLEEASLRTVTSRDPQDNVKQFIRFQHLGPEQMVRSEQPPTPPYEMFPPLKGPIAGLRGLPKLAIPPSRPDIPVRSQSANAFTPCSATALPLSVAPFSPHSMERGEALSPDLRNAARSPSVYRFGTPFSEMDIPVTTVPMGPVAREVSQSVPPNMSYHQGPPVSSVAPLQRSQSRISARRPSVQPLPRVDEHKQVESSRHIPPTFSNDSPNTSLNQIAQDIRTYSSSDPWSSFSHPPPQLPNSASYAGWMRKRKTKMLRHEWHEHHFTLNGTRLAMHRDARALETLEYIDVDDYAIACSSLASSSKLNAAFKAMNISKGKEKRPDVFAFQLIPQALEKGQKLRKRESGVPGVAGGNIGEGKDAGGKGKTHYFTVRSRDERIDWMRELMLAKALKQKNEGFEVNVNGNMI